MKLRARALIVPVVLGAALALPVSGGSSAAAATPGFSIHFGAPPIAVAGSIGPNQGHPFTVTVTLNGAPDPGGVVYLGYQSGVPTGHVTGDNTTVPASQCGGQTSLPTQGAGSGGVVRCTADSNGRVVLTYFAPAQPPAQGRADWIAWDTSSHPSVQAITHYVYTTVYRFNPSPIAAAASLAANASVPATLTADDGLSRGIPGSTVYLSFKQTSGGGSARAGSTTLTSTPTLFTADSSGAIQLTYTAPSTLPSSGQDRIVAQDLPSNPTGSNSDAYSFSPGVPVISVGDQSVVEGDQQPGIPANFSVTISAPQPNAVTVQYVTICGIGDKGCSEDFPQVGFPTTGTVTIPANATTTTFIVRQFSYVGRGAGESYNEGWFVELLNPSFGVVGRSVGTGVLLPDVESNNLVVPYLYVGDAGLVPTTATGGNQLWFTVTLGGLQGSDVSFSYATADGSAVAGHDYTMAAGTATIPANKSYTVIKVTVLPNTPPPTSRTFTLTISNASNGLTISRATGTGIVLSS